MAQHRDRRSGQQTSASAADRHIGVRKIEVPGEATRTPEAAGLGSVSLPLGTVRAVGGT